MAVKTPPAHRHGYPVASSALTKDRPSGSWLLANNPTLAFSSFLSNSSADDRPILSATRPTPLISSYSDTATTTTTTMVKSPSTGQRTRRKSTTAQKQLQPQPLEKPGRSFSFDTEFPTLTGISSPQTPTTADPSSSSSSATQHHVWSNTQRIQHKVKSPAKASWNGDGIDDDDADNMMEIERLKALVPRRHSHHQGPATVTSSSSGGIHRRRLPSSSTTTATSKVITRKRYRHSPSQKLGTMITTTPQQDASSLSSSLSSSGSSILSPSPPLSPITTNTTSTATTDHVSSSIHQNDVVTKQDQLRFYLFLKRWTGHSVGDHSADPSERQQHHQYHAIISRPLPIGTQRHDAYTTQFCD